MLSIHGLHYSLPVLLEEVFSVAMLELDNPARCVVNLKLVNNAVVVNIIISSIGM